MTELLPAREMGPCPVCGQTLARPIASCSQCHTPHHADCWSYNEGCAIYGCGAKPAPPPPASAARTLPRLSLTVAFMSLFALFALGGRNINVRVEDLNVDASGRVPCVSWMTAPRSRCVIEVVRADDPRVVLFRRHTPRSHHHRVELAFIKPGETYLVRVTSQSGLFAGETMSQLYRAPDEPASKPAQSFTAATTSLDLVPSAFATPESSAPPESSMPPKPHPAFRPRDPFRLPGHGYSIQVRPEVPRGPFTAFDLRLASHGAQLSWRTRQPLSLCRVLILRDSTLRGVEKVVDATSRVGGHLHRVSLDGLDPDTSYQVLVLGFPGDGDPIQSPVLSLRTLP